MSWLTKSLVPSVLARLGKFIGLSLGPKSLVPSVLAHKEPGPKCPGSTRKVYCLSFSSLEPGLKCPGTMWKSIVLRKIFLRNLPRGWSRASVLDETVIVRVQDKFLPTKIEFLRAIRMST